MATPQETPEQAIERRLTRLERLASSDGGFPSQTPPVAHDVSDDDEPGTLPPLHLRGLHLHCWLKPGRGSYPSMAEWMPREQQWACVGEVACVSPVLMRRRGWYWGEVAWASTDIEDDRRPEPPDPAEPTDEMLTSMATALREEWLMSPTASGTPSYFRRLACRAFEHAPYLVPDRPGSQPTQGWRPIATIAECKTEEVLLGCNGYSSYVWSTKDAVLRGAQLFGRKWWQPIEPPADA